MARAMRLLPAGETALVVEFGQTIDPAVHDRVMALDAALAATPIEGVVETVPTYRSLMIHYEPRRLSYEDLAERLRRLPEAVLSAPRPAPAIKRWIVPVCYELPHAEDLAEAAALMRLAPERVVALHAGAVYRVYMYGFSPGFTFLGGLPKELAISRRPSPRPPAPEGAILIAGGQALITSFSMPTGWYDIGRTPVRAFDPRRERVFLADIGDEVTFEPIDAARFEALRREAAAGGLVARLA